MGWKSSSGFPRFIPGGELIWRKDIYTVPSLVFGRWGTGVLHKYQGTAQVQGLAVVGWG